MSEKIKIMTISDMPFAPSGVGTQTRYIIDNMLKTGKYKFISLGGAMKHPNHQPIKTDEWQDDWITFPVDRYGSQEIVIMFGIIIRTPRTTKSFMNQTT